MGQSGGRVDVTVPQSEANSGTKEILERLLAGMPNLRALACTHRLTDGFSGSKIYLALATFQGAAARQQWILKLGTASDLRQEDLNYVLAKANVDQTNIASRIEYLEDGDAALFVLDYAGHASGAKPPVDLEKVLRQVEAPDAFHSLCNVIAKWHVEPRWATANLTQLLKQWTLPKLEKLPDRIAASAGCAELYSPDFGEAYSNPAYHLTRDLPRLEASTPFAFTHGDLNLRNCLFPRDDAGGLQIARPVLIDFRHASVEQPAIVDFAKLEASLRYQSLPRVTSNSDITEIVGFLGASRANLRLGSAPDSCTDKWLQELWRCTRHIREHVATLLGDNPERQKSYWVTLTAYAISTTTYEVEDSQRVLAYLDAGALFTRHVLPRGAKGPQFILPVHADYSPPVVTGTTQSATTSQLSLLHGSIIGGNAILITGPSYGRASGTESVTAFSQRIFKDLTSTDPPISSAPVLLEALARKRTRNDIYNAMRKRCERFDDTSDRGFATLPWALTVNLHFHDLPHRALLKAGHDVIRIDGLEDAVNSTDAIAGGARTYMPFHGDTHARPDNLALTTSDRRTRERVAATVARALEQRQTALSLVFWRCEDLTTEDVARIRDVFTTEMAVSVDAYFLSDIDDDARDASLAALDVARVRARMAELVANIGETAAAPIPTASGNVWEGREGKHLLPDIYRGSRGLLHLFSESLYPSEPKSTSEGDFLLGGPCRSADILDGRVVKRAVVDESILPAIRSAVAEHDRAPRAIVVAGRAGAGTSTLLCHAAFLLARAGEHPIVVADTKLSRGRKEWEEAGSLLADVSGITKKAVIVFAECSDATLEGIALMLQGALERSGRIVLVLGGRRESLLNKHSLSARALYFHEVPVGDSLSGSEWDAMARILKRHGFAKDYDVATLAHRMKQVGRLLPAIFEATDRQNRKFRDIVAYEYGRYSKDSMIQRAYRYICALGAFDIRISQYWLLKALGNRALSDARRILGALSEDIIVYRDDSAKSDDVTLSPLHRIIAEEVANVAAPEVSERLADLEALVATANLASESQGLSVATLLYSKGAFARWLKSRLPNDTDRRDRMRRLFLAAFANDPIHPVVQIHLRQHYALFLRRCREYDSALESLRIARSIEPDNMATIHILGLVHESRAIDAWHVYVRNLDDRALMRARGDEQDALDFFREVREARPHQEHGYESEARYYRKKRELLQRSSVSPDLEDESRLHVLYGLSLLSAAERRVPAESIVDTPRTRAYLQSLAGDLDVALKALKQQIQTDTDPVRKLRLRRVAAVVAAEGKAWDDAEQLLATLIASGEHDAALYLNQDDALAELGKSASFRAQRFQDSAEEFNRWDVETLVRWAELSLLESMFRRAIEALRRADEVARNDYSIFERERIRGVVVIDGVKKRFRGTVTRMLRSDEGYVRLGSTDQDVFFRVSPQHRGRVKIGASITFCVGWRIRGLRGVDVEIDGSD